MKIAKKIYADVSRYNLFEPLLVAEDDENSRYVDVTICDDGEPLVIPAIATVTVNYNTADGKVGTVSSKENENCYVNVDGTVHLPIPNECITIDDRVDCDISIIIPTTVTRHHAVLNDNNTVDIQTNVETVDSVLTTALFFVNSQYKARM